MPAVRQLGFLTEMVGQPTVGEDKAGVDLWVDGVGFQVKERTQYYGYDVALERGHKYEDGRLEDGWAMKESAASWLLYGWRDCFKNKKDTVILCMPMDKLVKACRQNAGNDSWRATLRRNNEMTQGRHEKWWTWNFMITVPMLREAGVPVAHYNF
jgi:hypothetical protein